MASSRLGGSAGNRIGGALSFADEPGDDDDLRLRKHIGVAAGYATIVAPLTIPLLYGGQPLASLLGISVSAYSAMNLVALARTRRFERFVVALVSSGLVLVPTTVWLTGGITLTSSGLVWGFLIPAYALLALGPARVGWFYGAFIAVVATALALEIAAPRPRDVQPYEAQLVGAVVNTVAPLTIVFAMLLYSDRRRRRAEARSEELLTNAIPVAIARRLQHGEQRIADTYPETTVLFADLAGFTPWARGADPARVVEVLDGLFRRFDAIVARGGLEKIKTIGDSYMAVSGAPEPRNDHARAALAVAQSMLGSVEEWRTIENVPLNIRIGLSSGQVVGGVIGDQRILFDLWGDTVNEAARMESTGLPGHIQLTESTRRLLPEDIGETRREVDVKGIGRMATYIVGRSGP